MTLNDYQNAAMETCMESCNNFSYMMLNLVGEVGEFASKAAKAIRKEQAAIGIYEETNEYIYTTKPAYEDAVKIDNAMMQEAGDILWQLAGLCRVMNWDLEEVAKLNLKKLASRKERGVIDGNGDER